VSITSTDDSNALISIAGAANRITFEHSLRRPLRYAKQPPNIVFDFGGRAAGAREEERREISVAGARAGAERV
jgi:hypothetical protein